MTPSIKQIQQRACQIWEIQIAQLLGKSKISEISAVSQLTMVCCRLKGFRDAAIDRAFNRSNGVTAHAKRTHCEEKFHKLDWQRWLILNESFESKI